MAQEVLLNRCYGGFDVSPELAAAFDSLKLAQKPGWEVHKAGSTRWVEPFRDDPQLIQLVRQFKAEGKPVDGKLAKLEIKAIKQGWEEAWDIQEYDGMETLTYSDDYHVLLQIRDMLQAPPQYMGCPCLGCPAIDKVLELRQLLAKQYGWKFNMGKKGA